MGDYGYISDCLHKSFLKMACKITVLYCNNSLIYRFPVLNMIKEWVQDFLVRALGVKVWCSKGIKLHACFY